MEEKYINPDSDGRFYVLEELARVNCQDCMGCSSCCHDMGHSIILDPFDIWQIVTQSGTQFNRLLEDRFLELTATDGLILPCINMSGQENKCPFLNKEERCSIHSYRPGLCRLFPLGRNFENGKMNYILLSGACDKKNRSKMKISNWIGIEHPEKYQEFITRWHYFKRNMSELLKTADEEQHKTITMYLLNSFYACSYPDNQIEFYKSFEKKVSYLEQTFEIGECSS